MTWWHRLWHRRRMEEQLEKELGFHIDQHAAELIAHGRDPVEARRQARLALGGAEQVKEECRDARGTRWLEDLWQDFRYALRTLRKAPGFAAVALLTLALGIGATTVMFTVIDGVLLKPLPYPQPDKLMAVHGHTATWNAALYGEQNLAHFDFLDCQRESRSSDLAGWVYNTGIMSEPGQAQHVEALEISSNLFSVLGVPLFLGRSFFADEDRPGGRAGSASGVQFVAAPIWWKPGSGWHCSGCRWNALYRCGHCTRGFPAGSGGRRVYPDGSRHGAIYASSRAASRYYGRAAAARRLADAGADGAGGDRPPTG